MQPILLLRLATPTRPPPHGLLTLLAATALPVLPTWFSQSTRRFSLRRIFTLASDAVHLMRDPKLRKALTRHRLCRVLSPSFMKAQHRRSSSRPRRLPVSRIRPFLPLITRPFPLLPHLLRHSVECSTTALPSRCPATSESRTFVGMQCYRPSITRASFLGLSFSVCPRQRRA